MRNVRLCVLIPCLILCGASYAQTDVYYMRANLGEPWWGWAPYANANPIGFDAVFGVGGWTLKYYETAVAATIFNSNTCYVYMEGGQDQANEMETFFTANEATIEQWVNNGGSLFMNAAPNEGDGMSYGFGGVWLWYPYWWASNVQPDPGAVAHPIWTGPYLPTTGSMWGTSFAHAYVTGPGLSPIIDDLWYPSYTILGEKTWGAGTVFFGGMTTASWQYPTTEAENLRQNMHSYLYALCGLVLDINDLSFDAREGEHDVDLVWVTDKEQNSDHFNAERSPDGLQWTVIGAIPAAGNTETHTEYHFTDVHPLPGKSYYRVTEYMNAGSPAESNIDKVEFENAFTCYPVPAVNELNISGISAEDDQVIISDATGQWVDCPVIKDGSIGHIDISNLSSGLYSVTLISNGTAQTLRFVKQ